MILSKLGCLWAATLLCACSIERKLVADEHRVENLCRELNTSEGTGVHGAFHHLKLEREQELWTILEGLPPDPGAAKILLRAVDLVYLRHHENFYHGWIWHWPYFDCSKAVTLADRAMQADPGSIEEALWTKIYCYRIQGLDGDAYPYTSKSNDFPTVKAQVRWKSDPEEVRRLCRDLQARFPQGKYASRASQLLEMKNVEVTLPDSWGKPAPEFTR